MYDLLRAEYLSIFIFIFIKLIYLLVLQFYNQIEIFISIYIYLCSYLILKINQYEITIYIILDPTCLMDEPIYQIVPKLNVEVIKLTLLMKFLSYGHFLQFELSYHIRYVNLKLYTT
jgi:hypothetical protein